MKDFKNISDQAIDDLFKVSAEKTLSDFDESAWEKMKGLLDGSVPDKGGFALKKPFVYSAIVILSLLTGYFAYERPFSENRRTVGAEVLNGNSENDNASSALVEVQNQKETENSKQALTSADKLITSAEQLPSGLNDHEVFTKKRLNGTLESSNSLDQSPRSNPKKANIRINEKGILTTIDNTIPALMGKNSIIARRSIVNGVSSEITENKQLLVNEIGGSSDGQDLISDQKEGVFQNSTREERNVRILDTDDISKDQKNLVEGQRRDEVISLEARIFNVDIAEMGGSNYRKFKTIFPLPLIMGAAVDKQTVEKGNRLSLRLAISPDFSSIPENNIFKIGHNWAALVEYRIKNRWILQTGVMKSVKYYTALSAQYRWPSNWGERPSELNHVNAKCNILDIPVNVRYDLTQGKNKWFVQGGLTSYLMLNEQYEYVYNEGSPAQKWNHWEGKTGFYAAGVANLSFGLEKKLGRRLSLQVEPFAKIPIGEVGFGDVKIATVGVFFSTNIGLVR
ncbi:MAG: hypothetical protein ACI9QN_000256 [Arcticibacterium sp.]|jgi:hypothetical protein